jgi:hypothetical protein
VLAVRIILALLLLACGIGCQGANCSKSSDCNTDGGESCLFPVGGGCSSQGHCEKQNSCNKGAGPPTVLCTCGGTNLALQCLPSNGITDQTTNGVCAVDGGSAEAGSDGGADGGLDGGTEE